MPTHLYIDIDYSEYWLVLPPSGKSLKVGQPKKMSLKSFYVALVQVLHRDALLSYID